MVVRLPLGLVSPFTSNSTHHASKERVKKFRAKTKDVIMQRYKEVHTPQVRNIYIRRLRKIGTRLRTQGFGVRGADFII